MKNQELQDVVRKEYTRIVKRNTSKSAFKGLFHCCGPKDVALEIGKKIGYSESELERVPVESNLSIGCGNPTALASIAEGESVLDLGSGAGFDCFLAAKKTGPTGKVIGVDITPEMVKKAKENAKYGDFGNVEFLVGEIESLPIPDKSIDLIISNCVINLSNRKQEVFDEAYRVLKTDGRMMFSDIVLLDDLPEFIVRSIEGHIACLAGSVRKEVYLSALKKAGFNDVNLDKQDHFPIELMLRDPVAQQIIRDNNLGESDIAKISNSIASVSISATKKN